jgi:hypothetical protein
MATSSLLYQEYGVSQTRSFLLNGKESAVFDNFAREAPMGEVVPKRVVLETDIANSLMTEKYFYLAARACG